MSVNNITDTQYRNFADVIMVMMVEIERTDVPTIKQSIICMHMQ
jgi:hypothetical protein